MINYLCLYLKKWSNKYSYLILHPEVKNIGLVTLLFAGTTSLFSFKYSLLIDIVKILKRWSLSAGNIFIFFLNLIFKVYINLIIKSGTSETLCNEIVVKENIKEISIHVPKHLKPLNDDQFGHYLAGLIDGDGHFSKQQQLIISFNYLDVSLAYYLKSRLGLGNVRKVKGKNAVLYIISSQLGIRKVINLIKGKIRTESKINQINSNILNHVKYADLKKEINFKLNLDKDLKNHWLAGFSDADASFQIKIINKNNNNKVEVRLNFQIDQKFSNILLLIKEFLGGNLGYRKFQDTYYYGSTSFGSAKKVINYFDYYHLLSSKQINYLKWRKAYLIIQNKNHLNKEGIDKIIKLKNNMNCLSDTTI